MEEEDGDRRHRQLADLATCLADRLADPQAHEIARAARAFPPSARSQNPPYSAASASSAIRECMLPFPWVATIRGLR